MSPAPHTSQTSAASAGKYQVPTLAQVSQSLTAIFLPIPYTPLAPFLDGRAVLPITAVNTPWYKTYSSNPQTKFTNWWNDLIESVQKSDEEFPHLPFGSLRDALPDVLRLRYSDDVASLALQHGEISDDPLLKHYANKPYKRLFEATRELRSHFQPMLDELVRQSE